MKLFKLMEDVKFTSNLPLEKNNEMRAAAQQVRPNYDQGRVNAVKPIKLEDIL